MANDVFDTVQPHSLDVLPFAFDVDTAPVFCHKHAVAPALQRFKARHGHLHNTRKQER